MYNTLRLAIVLLFLAVELRCVQIDKPSAQVNGDSDSLIKSRIGDSSTFVEYIMHPDGDSTGAAFEDTVINNIQFDDCYTINRLFGDSIHLLPDYDDLPRIQITN